MQSLRRYAVHLPWLLPLAFFIETCVRRMSEPDLFFYYALVEFHLRHGVWPTTDPFVYTLPQDVLMTAHQWLGYWIYYLPFQAFDWAGPILLKTFFVALFLLLPLWPMWRRRRGPPIYFVLVWTLVIYIAHHRFRERVSLFGDLFVLCLVMGLTWWRDRRWFWYALPPAFLLWAQLHPSWPLGWAILLAFFATHRPSTWRLHMLTCTLLCFFAPLFNPLGLQGLLYPFTFARDIEPYLRQYVVEWLPLTDRRLFTFTFLYLPFVTVIPFTAFRLWGQRRQAAAFEWFVFLLALALNIKSVRFGLMAQGLFLLLLVNCELRQPLHAAAWLKRRGLMWITVGLSAAAVFVKEYTSNTWRVPLTDRFRIETSYFPETAAEFVQRAHPQMHVFNSFGFGGYLAWRWQGQPPIYFHGFSTNFDFYEKNYNAPQLSREGFDAMTERWQIGVFLLSKLGNDDGFIRILRVHPDWQNIHEDPAAVVFAKRDPRVFH
jgi:hypothetical protein